MDHLWTVSDGMIMPKICGTTIPKFKEQLFLYFKLFFLSKVEKSVQRKKWPFLRNSCSLKIGIVCPDFFVERRSKKPSNIRGFGVFCMRKLRSEKFKF
jgi:hypothetical protein